MKVILIAALSADGLLARDSDDFSMDWTSPEDMKLFVRLTKEAGVMVMGARTFTTTIAAGRRLPGRKIVVYSSKSASAHNRTDPTEFTAEPPETLLMRLAGEGYQCVAICGGSAVYDMFLRAGLIDELYLTFEPVLFGAGVSLAKSPLDIRLKLIANQQLNESTCMLHYEVQK
ncbi:MAG TPA: dihydrofolate reductase family protein [Candidatus Saccharimonadales bacterium]|nr:dihydrofolate reductase family protein [Candidatus Saccharimonadales bacterium]